jgi:hypothetical protein
MEQVKTFLAAVKKHHFWILCGLAVLIGLGMTISAKTKLLKDYEDEKGKINSAQTSVAPFATGQDHPNPTWVDDAKAKTVEAQKKVFDAWNKLYQEQAKSVFQWPLDLTDDQAFLKEFAAADDQTEKKLDRKKLDELAYRYISYITKVTLPRLATIIDAEWTAGDDKDAARRAAAGPDAAEAVSHKVVWDSADQQHKFDDYNWQERPSRLDMQYAQEEMWVMEALFKAIQRANSDARGSYDAAVRQLNEVLVGYDATNRYPLGEGAGRIIRTTHTLIPAVGTSAPSGGDSSAPARSMIEPRRPDRQNGVAGGGGSSGVRPTTGRGGAGVADSSAPVGPEAAADPSAWLKDGRYVKVPAGSVEIQPLLGSELQSTSTPEYKLMAFRLRLVVDEAQYPRIIEELASSVLPIEVREVQILPNGQNVGQSAPARRQTPGRGPGRQLTMRDPSAPTMSAPRPRPVTPTPSSAPAEGGTSHTVPLEIYGVVYLIERPDPKKLNLPDTSSGAAASATTTGTATPAAATTSTEAPAAAGTATTATASAPSTTAATDATAPAAATTVPPAATGGATSTTADTAKGNGAGSVPATTAPPSVAPK